MTERWNPPVNRALVAAVISAELTAIHTETYGTPVKAATTHVLDDLVVVVLDIELTAMEQHMRRFGRDHLVHELRHAVEEAEGTAFVAAVEHATGRRVAAFASHTHIDAPFVVELFRLAPRAAEPAESQ